MKKYKLLSLRSLAPQPKVRKPNRQASKLAAHAGRLAPPAYEDYEEEPTTKLSTAFVVVLVLHLVAVGGIYAFHSIKAKRRDADGTAAIAKAGATQPSGQSAPGKANATAPVLPPVATVNSAGVQANTPHVTNAKTGVSAVHQEKTATQLPAPAAGPSAVLPQAKVGAGAAPVQANAAPKATPVAAVPVKAVPPTAPVQPSVVSDPGAKTYTVVKGDNPVAIAKRMNVNYEEMLRLNAIDDPKKLKIGQVLKLPAKKQSN